MEGTYFNTKFESRNLSLGGGVPSSIPSSLSDRSLLLRRFNGSRLGLVT